MILGAIDIEGNKLRHDLGKGTESIAGRDLFFTIALLTPRRKQYIRR